MMRKKGNGKEQKTKGYLETFREPISHKGTLHLENFSAAVISVRESGRIIAGSNGLPDTIQFQT
jgi:hypothetical protein